MSLQIAFLLVLFSMKVKMFGFRSTCSSVNTCVVTLVVVVCLTGCHTNTVPTEDSENCQNNTISVLHETVFENESIELVCHNPEVNASALSFKYGGTEYVPQNYTEILNATSIKLVLPPFERETMSDEFKCMQGDKCVANTHVFYEYYPVQAEDIDCRMFDWERMLCSWSLGVKYKTERDVKVTCDFTMEFLSKEPYARAWAKCPNLTKTSCYWDEDHFTNPFDKLNVSIKIVNTRRPEAFVYTNISFPVDDIVQLDPVNANSISVMKTEDPHCLNLSWPVTGRAKYKTLTFNVTYSCPCVKSKTQYITYSKSDGTAQAILCGLHPHCAYSVRISARYIKHWSDPTTLPLITDKQVPAHSPLMTAGLYEHIVETNNIKVYWKPLDICELNSDLSTVNYTASVAVNHTDVRHPVFYMKIQTQEEPQTVTIQARNDIGYANDRSSIQVFPKHIGHKPSDVMIEFSEKSGDSVHNITIDPRDADTSGHTVVWCKGNSFCEEPIYWRVLPLFELRPMLRVSREHRFGLITKYKSGQNSGIVWEKCLHQAGKVPEAPPRDVHRSDDQPVEGFRLEWLPYNCKEGYIHHYQLTYCPSKPGTNCSCTSAAVHVNVSKQETNHYVKGLSAGTLVCVSLRGVSLSGPGPVSEPITFTIPEKIISPWIYVGIVLAVIIVIIVVVLVVYFTPRIRKHYESNARVKDILGDQPLLKREQDHSAEVQIPMKENYSSDVSNDSGKSSLCTDSAKTNISGKDRNSDSAISSDHEEQTKRLLESAEQPYVTPETQPSQTLPTNDSDIELSTYTKACRLSLGDYTDSSVDTSVLTTNANDRGEERESHTPLGDPSGALNDDKDKSDTDNEDCDMEYDLNDISDILDMGD